MTPVVINFDSIYLLWLIFKTKQKIIWNWHWALVFIHATYISVQQTTSSKKKEKEKFMAFFWFHRMLVWKQRSYTSFKKWIWDNTYKVNEISSPSPWPGLRKTSVTLKAQKIFEIPVPVEVPVSILGLPLPSHIPIDVRFSYNIFMKKHFALKLFMTNMLLNVLLFQEISKN